MKLSLNDPLVKSRSTFPIVVYRRFIVGPTLNNNLFIFENHHLMLLKFFEVKLYYKLQTTNFNPLMDVFL